jgi:L-arabinokinase
MQHRSTEDLRVASVVFYISGHGFGHASRDVEVINALGSGASHRLLIRTAVSPDLLTRTIRVPYTLLPGVCDTGIVQATSVTHDDPATVRATVDFYRTYADRVDDEVRRLAGEDVRLIVGDIPPLAFATAARLGVPSIALGNFTWDWIYETHAGFVPDGADALRLIRDSYRHATLALELPFSGGFEIFPNVRRVPLIARRATHARDATRAHFGLAADARVALLSFGGYGLPSLDLAEVDCRDTWTIVTTDRVSDSRVRTLRHVRALSEADFLTSAFRYEDLVAAADVVVTKPGFGIIAECISTGTAMLYTSRGAFREYDVLVAALPRYVRSRFISQDALFAGTWRASLDALVTQPAPPEHMAATGADDAAAIIRAMI